MSCDLAAYRATHGRRSVRPLGKDASLAAGRISFAARLPSLAAILLIATAGCAAGHPAAGRSMVARPLAGRSVAGEPGTSKRVLPTVGLTHPAARTGLPAVAGGGVRALWQGPALNYPTVSGGMLLGTTLGPGPAQVNAIRAATGVPAWTVSLRPSLPEILGLVPASGVVVVESGHSIGQAPGMVSAVVSEYVALDTETGRQLWAIPVDGAYQAPPIAAVGNLLLTGDASGAVTARATATGAVLWRGPRPASCRLAPSGGSVNAGLGLAADGTLAVASFDCGPRVIVQRLNTANGRPLWTWTSPAVAAGAGMYLSATGGAGGGGVVLLTGQIGPAPAAAQFLARLPRPYPWPSSLGPPDPVSTVLALAAADGQPLWSELGGQMETFALTGGAVCETSPTGLECRADATGTVTMPDLVTGQAPGDGPTYANQGFAGVSGDLAAVTVAPSRPGSINLRVVTIRGAISVQARLGIGISAYGGMTVEPLEPGTVLVLIRRVSLAGGPVLALAVPVPGLAA